jgi:hypothetical protein
MNSDKFQDKYDEIFQELKNEKMDWRFEDFLENAENTNEKSVIPLHSKKPNLLPKVFWIAASLTLIFGIAVLFKHFKLNKPDENIVKKEILKQKNAEKIKNSPKLAMANDTVKTPTKDSVKTPEIKSSEDDDSLDKILSNKSRLRKSVKLRYAHYKPAKKLDNNAKIEYQPDFVTINGYKITNEEEAINVTKVSFQMLSQKMEQTIASSIRPESQEDF